MSEPSATPQFPSSPAGSVTGDPAGPAPPKTLLEQMQELLASVTADLAALQSDARDATPAAVYPADTDTSGTPATPGTR
ncbi:hypothetical protein ACFWIQ_28965 [Kitasatospora sp. NPDC127059]|uniref:hypothetical protein n=1 Tax=unclassified Kitasatospora TaxID=2633591 RepID=UPI00366409BE